MRHKVEEKLNKFEALKPTDFHQEIRFIHEQVDSRDLEDKIFETISLIKPSNFIKKIRSISMKNKYRKYSSFDFFNPNIYFNILTNLKIKEDYLLDYVYLGGESGGHPEFYFRKKIDKPFILVAFSKVILMKWFQKLFKNNH